MNCTTCCLHDGSLRQVIDTKRIPFYRSVFHTGNEGAQYIHQYEKFSSSHKTGAKYRALVTGGYKNEISDEEVLRGMTRFSRARVAGK